MFELGETDGWASIQLHSSSDKPMLISILKISILANAQNGRDCHIRQVQVWGRVWPALPLPDFHSNHLRMFACIR